jgi:hypothetical protein
VGSTRFSGADPDALGALAVALEQAANDLERCGRQLATTGRVPSAGRLRTIVDWLSREAGDVRRRAVLAASAGASWRHADAGGIVGHLFGVARSVAGGYEQGVLDVAKGVEGVATFDVAVVVDPVRAATMTWQAAYTMEASDPAVRIVRYAQSIGRDGFWPATDTFAHDTAEQIPTALLAALGGPALGPAPRALSNLSYVGPFVPPATSASHPRGSQLEAALRLSVPVGTAGTKRVALDPADGRFVLFDGRGGTVSTHTFRWNDLSDEEQVALIDAGIVDRKGRLRDKD